MGNYKGVGVVFLRDLMKRTGESAEKTLLNRLDSDQAQIYRTAMPFKWYPVSVTTGLFEVAAEVAFPGDPNKLRKLGKELASDQLKGVYRLLLKVATIPMAIKRAAQLWGTYHDTGKATAWTEGSNRAIFQVAGYHTLPLSACEVLCGFVRGVVELTRATNVDVVLDRSNPSSLKWIVTWM